MYIEVFMVPPYYPLMSAGCGDVPSFVPELIICVFSLFCLGSHARRFLSNVDAFSFLLPSHCTKTCGMALNRKLARDNFALLSVFGGKQSTSYYKE